jgi:hypothetical protein
VRGQPEKKNNISQGSKKLDVRQKIKKEICSTWDVDTNSPIGSTATYCPASLDVRRGVMNCIREQDVDKKQKITAKLRITDVRVEHHRCSKSAYCCHQDWKSNICPAIWILVYLSLFTFQYNSLFLKFCLFSSIDFELNANALTYFKLIFLTSQLYPLKIQDIHHLDIR